jgi:hypothetical protein
MPARHGGIAPWERFVFKIPLSAWKTSGIRPGATTRISGQDEDRLCYGIFMADRRHRTLYTIG